VHLVYELLDASTFRPLVDAAHALARGTVTVLEVAPAGTASPSGVLSRRARAGPVFAMLDSMGVPQGELVVAGEPPT